MTLIGDAAAFIGAIAIVGYLVAGRFRRAWMPLFVYAFPVTLIAATLIAFSSMVLEGTTFSGLPSNSSLIGWGDLIYLPAVAYLAFGPGLVAKFLDLALKLGNRLLEIEVVVHGGCLTQYGNRQKRGAAGYPRRPIILARAISRRL